MANSVDPDQTAPIGAVCSGSMLLASILNSSVMLGNYLQQTTSAEDIFRCIFFLGALRVKTYCLLSGYERFPYLKLVHIRGYLINTIYHICPVKHPWDQLFLSFFIYSFFPLLCD